VFIESAGTWKGTPDERPNRVGNAKRYPEKLSALASAEGQRDLRARRRGLEVGRQDYVFSDSRGRPLDQDLLAKRAWKPTIKKIGLSERGQYNTKDTFITLALSAGEDPGWVAQVAGTSEQMIFQHYRRWIPGLQTDAGQKVGRVLGAVAGGRTPRAVSPPSCPRAEKSRWKISEIKYLR
jgi:hypothetical protein